MSVYLPRALACLTDNAAKESTRYSLCGVHVVHTDSTYRLESTDGHQLVIVEGTHSKPVKGSVKVDANGKEEFQLFDYSPLQTAPNGRLDFVVPSEDWNASFKAIARKDTFPLGIVAADDGTLTLATSNIVKTSRVSDGRFPEVKHVVPKPEEKPAMSISFNPAVLSKVIDTAKKLGIENVTLDIYPAKDIPAYRDKPAHQEHKPVQLRGKLEDGTTFLAIVMPLT